jgi:uncharacterized protein YbjT (DUF2867 family)
MSKKPLTIAIMGASGFVGRNLITHLLTQTDYRVKALCRHPETLTIPDTYASRVEVAAVDVFHKHQVAAALEGCDIAVYLLHMMYRGGNYYKHEATAAADFGHAVRAAGIPRVVYMSGLGDDNDTHLSRHLRSRHHTGDVLRKYVPEVVELRASMIVGDGSAAYEIMKRLVKNLPVQTMPSWAVTQTQPITLHDAVRYVTAALTVPITRHEIVEIGGPEHLTYKDLIARYAKFRGKKPLLLVVPIVPIRLSGWWLNLFTPPHEAKIGRAMAESLRNPMIVTNRRAKELFPEIHPEPIENAFTQ